jgi:hypothetical protein
MRTSSLGTHLCGDGAVVWEYCVIVGAIGPKAVNIGDIVD